ncbi:MAG: hypothetical protein LUF90_01760 [Rikenellaceae bacterium]|nr:hypothetical protein [Rikenellaceae bacterium]
MKKINKVLFPALLCLCAAFSVQAQQDAFLEDPKYGNTPEERRETVVTIQYFVNAARGERYDDAFNYLRQLLEKAPQSSENIYYLGIPMYKTKFAEAKSSEERKAILDTISTLYELRLQHFGEHPERGTAYILKNYAADIYSLTPEDKETIYGLYERAVLAVGDNPDLSLISNFLALAYNDYNLENIETDKFLGVYELLSSALDKSTDPNAASIRQNLDNALVSSGAADCDEIEKIYRPQYEKDPDNLDLIKKIVGMMNRSKCSSDFLLSMTEKYYEKEPSAQTALYLADAFDARGEGAKATQYLQLAIDNETDITAKSNLLVRLGAISLSQNNYRQAADYARQAISVNSENGWGHFILAQAYSGAVNSLCTDDFSKRAAYWLIVDVLNQAARRFPAGDPQLRTINSYIGNYSSYFPDSEALFFSSNNLQEGSSYTVNCGWISGQTTVRAKK